jgi:hypothetical protein
VAPLGDERHIGPRLGGAACGGCCCPSRDLLLERGKRVGERSMVMVNMHALCSQHNEALAIAPRQSGLCLRANEGTTTSAIEMMTMAFFWGCALL